MRLHIHKRYLPNFGPVYCPVGDGPFPALMILHGSEGGWSGWSHQTAVMFAAHGFIAFPFCYSTDGNAWNAGKIQDVSLDQSVTALAAVRAFPGGNGKVGLYGGSRGAEHALLLSALMARDGISGGPDAVAAHSAPDVICGAFNAREWRDAGDPGWQAWDPGQRAWTWRGSSEALLPTMPIEIERIAAPIFLSHGTADRVWSVDMTRRLAQRLNAHGKVAVVALYEGEDHIFSSAAMNRLYEQLLEFFSEHLVSKI